MKRFICFFVCLYSLSFFAQNKITSNEKDSTSTWQILKYDSKATIQSVGHAFTRPLYWDKTDFRKFTTIATGIFALSLADKEVSRFTTSYVDTYPQIGRSLGFRFGKPQAFFLLNTGLYGYGLFTKNKAFRKTSVLIISSAITTGLIQSFGKQAFGRARPNSGLGHDSFHPFSGESYHHSFPSGHTVLSVTMAHAIAKQLDNIWFKIGVYSLGSITPITRLVEGAHWLTDVVAGAVLSIVVVDSIDKFLSKNEAYTHKKKRQVSWNLSLSGNQIGIIGTF